MLSPSLHACIKLILPLPLMLSSFARWARQTKWKVFRLHGVPLGSPFYGKCSSCMVFHSPGYMESSRGSNMESVPLAKIGSSRLPTLFFFVIETNKFLKAVVFI